MGINIKFLVTTRPEEEKAACVLATKWVFRVETGLLKHVDWLG